MAAPVRLGGWHSIVSQVRCRTTEASRTIVLAGPDPLSLTGERSNLLQRCLEGRKEERCRNCPVSPNGRRSNRPGPRRNPPSLRNSPPSQPGRLSTRSEASVAVTRKTPGRGLPRHRGPKLPCRAVPVNASPPLWTKYGLNRPLPGCIMQAISPVSRGYADDERRSSGARLAG